ncbi:hypothetical protein FQA39_LY00660 [Lamprigera yunnana]|nr:hypothetical protein FQA39_LY00660 [Lamprigera yunnana]
MGYNMLVKRLCIIFFFTFVLSEEWNYAFLENPDEIDNAWIDNEELNIITMNENIDRNISIVFLNYKGESTPVITGFTEPGSNAEILLGPSFHKESNSYWALDITKLQDYESTQVPLRRYAFNIKVENKIAVVILYINNIDDESPIIETTSENNPCKIKETTLTSEDTNCVFAILDSDGIMDETVTYTLSSTIPVDDTFKIENVEDLVNGNKKWYTKLTLLRQLDYEEMISYILDFEVKDSKGNNDIVKIVVEVIDSPDTQPIWKKIFSSQRFPEKQLKNFEVKAVDGDIGINAVINYKIQSEWSELFKIDENTGVITIEPINRDELKQELFSFTVRAYEKENTTSFTEELITIVIDDINDNSPLIEVDSSHTSILENKVGTLGISITVSDIDLGNNAKYAVSLVQNKYAKAFNIIPSSGYQTATFSVIVVQPDLLDYEEADWREIELIIQTEEYENSDHVDTKTITISLENWNDETPQFNQTEYSVEIPEDASDDYVIATVLATDRDVGDFVTYSLLGTAINKMFSIDDDGVIRTITKNVFDYERQSIVIIQISANDNLGETHHTTVGQLTIRVTDVNDETPTIDVLLQPIEVQENQADGTVVNKNTVISAYDDDTQADLKFSINWEKSYAVKNGRQAEKKSYEKCIHVETERSSSSTTVNAILKINEIIEDNTPDYELFDTLYISLVVTDEKQDITPNSHSVLVTIAIKDINDNAPVFVNDTITSKKIVMDGAEKDSKIGIVTATDIDGPDYNQISYSIKITDDVTPCNWIRIDSRGELFVKDNELVDADGEVPVYTINCTVVATNLDLINETKIVIEVIDRNDESPECKFTTEVEIPEDIRNGTEIPFDLSCTDGDRDERYNTPWFSFSNSVSGELKNLFSIDKFSGKIFVTLKEDAMLDRDEGTTEYTIFFIVSDNYNQSGTTEQKFVEYNLKVILLDVNDNEPIIKSDHFNAIEDMTEGNVIGTIIATDIDQPGHDNSKIQFSINNITKGIDEGKDPPEDLFTIKVIESGKGELITNWNLNSFYGTYIVSVKALDYGSPQKSSDKDIKISIEKYNFEEPIFIYPEEDEKLYLLKEQGIGKQLRKYDGQLLDPFIATDQQNEKWDIVMTIEEETTREPTFSLVKTGGKNTAHLVLKRTPTSSTYDIILKADCNCSGKEPYTSSRSISINFINYGAEPEFQTNKYSINLIENTVDITEKLPQAYFNDQGEVWDLFTVYYFLDDDAHKFFKINKTSAELLVVNPLDREQTTQLTVKVITSRNSDGNSSASQRSTLTVLVTDINDNPPNFDETQFHAGITSSDKVEEVILPITATDLDLDDELFFEIVPATLSSNGTGLGSVQNPFYIMHETQVYKDHIIGHGNIYLNFRVQSSMTGYFTFDVRVVDQGKCLIRTVLEDNIKYLCNIDDIRKSADELGTTLNNLTDVTVHFVDNNTNEAIDRKDIEMIITNYEVFSKIRKELSLQGVYILSFNTYEEVDNSSEVLRIVLIVVSVVLGTLCVILITAFILKTRSLLARLNKLTSSKFGSQESGLNRAGLTAPNTNKHAIEGSNPIYSTEKKVLDIDRHSISSGDSDLIGIENNPNFDFGGEIIRRVSTK